MLTIRRSTHGDFEVILSIVNDAAQAYKGVIPDGCWKEPYMPREELHREVESGVEFWLCEEEAAAATGARQNGNRPAGGRFEVLGVMGIQHLRGPPAVGLIRHAYVKPARQNQGVGSLLLEHIRRLETSRPLLVGTWKSARWAIGFYEKHGFSLVAPVEKKDELLMKYWSVPKRQMEESAVLADERWTMVRHR